MPASNEQSWNRIISLMEQPVISTEQVEELLERCEELKKAIVLGQTPPQHNFTMKALNHFLHYAQLMTK